MHWKIWGNPVWGPVTHISTAAVIAGVIYVFIYFIWMIDLQVQKSHYSAEGVIPHTGQITAETCCAPDDSASLCQLHVDKWFNYHFFTEVKELLTLQFCVFSGHFLINNTESKRTVCSLMCTVMTLFLFLSGTWSFSHDRNVMSRVKVNVKVTKWPGYIF